MPQIRRLAAIMFTDIVGYTSLMGRNEEIAFRVLNRNREIQKPIIKQYHGRWIKELGDGVIASFDSVSDSVHAAIKIQEDIIAVPDLQLRIGIHLGEVVFENEDVFGDGVNIAARIQGIAPPGSIYVSEGVYHNVVNKEGIETRFVRLEALKNVKAPVRIYEVLSGHDSNTLQLSSKKHSEETKGQSIAVLPFVNMSNDPDQDYFCDGIAEEIIDSLAQLKNLRVIARTSAFSFKGKNIDVREIGKTLDVITLLEGSVRKSGNRIRITTKLVKVADGSHLWANRYDRELLDIFSIQEDIATNVATELKGLLTRDEKEMMKPRKTVVEAYEFYLKGRHYFHELALESSKNMFEASIDIDPGYAPAYAGLSSVHAQLFEWFGGTHTDLEKAETYCQRALSLSPNMAEGHSAYGYVLSLHKRYDEAESEFHKAIELDPKSFDAYYRSGRMYFACGEIEKSAEMFLKASEVRPEDFQSLLLAAQSLNILGNKQADKVKIEGLKRVRKQLDLNPTDRRALSLGSVNLFEIGEEKEALDWIYKALDLYPDDGTILFNGVCLFIKAGKKEKALDLLENIIEQGLGNKEWIEQDPDYNPIRNDPKFLALMKKLEENDDMQ